MQSWFLKQNDDICYEVNITPSSIASSTLYILNPGGAH